MKHHAIVMEPQGLTVWRRAGDHFECEIRIEDEQNPTALHDWLAREHRHCAFVADVADERHTIERLPRVARADRLQLIRRRLAQHFPDTPLTRASALPCDPRDSTFRPVLLSALTRPSRITPCLDHLASHPHVDVRGVTSVPFLIERWFRRQRKLPHQALILSLGAGGMRLLFFRQRRLTLSRVIAARAATLPECLPTYSDELKQTLNWLASQNLTEGEVSILVLANETECSVLRELDNESITFIPHSDNLLSLALKESQRFYRPGQYCYPPLQRRQPPLRRALWGMTAAIGMLGLSLTAARYIDIQQVQHETARARAERQSLRESLSAIPDRPEPNSFSDWLDQVEQLANAPNIPTAYVLQAVAALLEQAPWAQLESLYWTNSAHFAGSNVELEMTLTENLPHAAATLSEIWRKTHGNDMTLQIIPPRLTASFVLPEKVTP